MFLAPFWEACNPRKITHSNEPGVPVVMSQKKRQHVCRDPIGQRSRVLYFLLQYIFLLFSSLYETQRRSWINLQRVIQDVATREEDVERMENAEWMYSLLRQVTSLKEIADSFTSSSQNLAYFKAWTKETSNSPRFLQLFSKKTMHVKIYLSLTWRS